MPTAISQSTIDELRALIQDACERGDNVSSIARRAGLRREMVSGLRNGTYTSSPSLEFVEQLCQAIGCRLEIRKGNNDS